MAEVTGSSVILVTKPLLLEGPAGLFTEYRAPALTGKSSDFVRPTTQAPSTESRATPKPSSKPAPPRKVEATTAVPSALKTVRKASPSPLSEPCTAPFTGKNTGEVVEPTTQARDEESTATALPWVVARPRRVEYTIAEPLGDSLVTKASNPCEPWLLSWKGSPTCDAVGKLLESVLPVTKALPDESTAMPSPQSVSPHLSCRLQRRCPTSLPRCPAPSRYRRRPGRWRTPATPRP